MRSLLDVSDGEIYTLWWISVAVVLVVAVVAAGLLQNILVVGRAIGAHVHEIWTVGKRIANHTVQLWLLGRVNGLVGQITDSEGRIDKVATQIADHARNCRHCPSCVSPVGAGYTRGGEDERTSPRTQPA